MAAPAEVGLLKNAVIRLQQEFAGTREQMALMAKAQDDAKRSYEVLKATHEALYSARAEEISGALTLPEPQP